MKKMVKNRLEKISSRIGIIIFCILLILVIKRSGGIFSQIRELEYGPYICGKDTLSIHVEEHKNKLEGTGWNEIHFIWNNEEIRTTENYNFEGVKGFVQLPWKTKCTPLIINEASVVTDLANCFDQKMKDESLERDRQTKNGLPFQICGIGYYNAGEKYE